MYATRGTDLPLSMKHTHPYLLSKKSNWKMDNCWIRRTVVMTGHFVIRVGGNGRIQDWGQEDGMSQENNNSSYKRDRQKKIDRLKREEQDIQKKEFLFTLQIPLKKTVTVEAKSINLTGKTEVTGGRTTKKLQWWQEDGKENKLYFHVGFSSPHNNDWVSVLGLLSSLISA